MPALILLDVMLPGLSGTEILRQLELQQRTREIRKIMLSARVSETNKVRALELGAEDHPLELQTIIGPHRWGTSLWILMQELLPFRIARSFFLPRNMAFSSISSCIRVGR
jgi:CheY-like chemotaxis protein